MLKGNLKRRSRYCASFAVFVLAMLASFSSPAHAQVQQTLFSIVPQSGYSGPCTPTCPLTAPGHPYTFSQSALIASIDTIAVELGGGKDKFPLGEGELTIALDGIDTGIPVMLGGAEGTVTGVPQNKDLILAALKQDGQLVGSIIDHTPGDVNVGIFEPPFATTLEITANMDSSKKKGKHHHRCSHHSHHRCHHGSH